MSTTPSRFGRLLFSDLRGVTRLAAQATVQVAGIAEGVHRAVDRTLGLPVGPGEGRAGGIAGGVYAGVRGIARIVGRGADAGLLGLERLSGGAAEAGGESRRRQAALAVLNGVMGDRLAEDGSPLALPMSLRGPDGEGLEAYLARQPEDKAGKILLVVHGLCLNDLAWQPEPTPETKEPDPGGGTERPGGKEDLCDLARHVASALGSTPVYLRYNTGLHISVNGRRLSAALERLVESGSRPIERLDVVAHSMGGLVVRSAHHYAVQAGLRWPEALRSLVFLGTPHHGAPLEKLGSAVDALLGGTRWTIPFRKIGRLRSAGITDLRYGNLLDEDWGGKCRFGDRHDRRVVLPLPDGVLCLAFAAGLAPRGSEGDPGLQDRLLGDGLVPVSSALGRHRDPRRTLAFEKSSVRVVHGTGHNELMFCRQVAEQIADRLVAVEGPKRVGAKQES